MQNNCIYDVIAPNRLTLSVMTRDTLQRAERACYCMECWLPPGRGNEREVTDMLGCVTNTYTAISQSAVRMS